MALFKKGFLKRAGRGISRFTKKPFFKKALGFGASFIPGAGAFINGLGGLFKKKSSGLPGGESSPTTAPPIQPAHMAGISNLTYDNRTFMLAILAAAIVAYNQFKG